MAIEHGSPAPEIRESEGDNPYYYVDGELRVQHNHFDAFVEAATALEVEVGDPESIGETEYQRTRISGGPPIPELVARMREQDIDCFPHHVMAIETHTQYGPHDAPAAIDPIKHPQLWNEQQVVEGALQSADKSGKRVVIIDTGLLRPLGDLGDAVDQPSDNEQPAAPAPGKMSLYYGHGHFVAGVVAQTNPNAIIHVFRPILSTVNDELLVLDDDLAEVLVTSLEQLAGRGRGPGSPLERANDAASHLLDPNNSNAKLPHVLNLSLAGAIHDPLIGNPLPAAREILDVWRNRLGVDIVAAAGNAHTNQKHYPAAYDDVVGVGAVDRAGTLTGFSNWGDWVDEYRLGRNVVSTYVNGAGGSNVQSKRPKRNPNEPHRDNQPGPWNGYAAWSGTSFAAPRVAGELSGGTVQGPGGNAP